MSYTAKRKIPAQHHSQSFPKVPEHDYSYTEQGLMLSSLPLMLSQQSSALAANPHGCQTNTKLQPESVTTVRDSFMSKITIRCLSKQEDFRLT